MLLKITNGALSFGAETVLENVNIEINAGEKIAVVGRNGAGKTTLLRCITGELTMEEGTGEEPFAVTRAGGLVIGYLRQIGFTDESATMIDEILTVFKPLTDTEAEMNALVARMQTETDDKLVARYAALQERFEFLGGYTYQKEYSAMIKKFGFTEADRQKRISEFSGGQRTKIAFIKLLLAHPDILLLDEPTNHLDIAAIRWLENYIKNYKSAVVMVSHDRAFIEKTVDKVYEIEYGETRGYKGNYSDFERQKRLNYEKQVKDYEARQAEIARLSRLVERFRYKANKAAMAQSKLKQIQRLKTMDRPEGYDTQTFHAHFQPQNESVERVLTAAGLTVGYDHPLATVDLELKRGQKLGVIGENGIGKSTFLKTIMGQIKPLSGEFAFGRRVEIGYFNQQIAQYRSDSTVLDDFCAAFPALSVTEARTALGSFLFTGDDVFKTLSELSGGERVRLALCKLFKKQPNLLILDEPTNHMDIVGKATLEEMLLAYTGTVIVVSHDRYLINKVADRLLVFTPGSAVLYPMRYAEYEQQQTEEETPAPALNKPVSGGKKTYSSPLKDKARRERRMEQLETKIGVLEAEIADLNQQLTDPEIFADYVKIGQIQAALEEKNAALAALTEEWLRLSETDA